MSPFDSLLDRVTEKLRPDPELRLEVRHELAAHLEDCATEFESAGINHDDAAKKAAESFGDEAEVSQKLYAANRQRMKARTVVRWAGRFTLASAAVAVLVPIASSAVASALMIAAIMSGLQIGQAPSSPWIERSILAHLSPAQRLVFEGPTDGLTHAQKAKAILDRSPNDPVLYANYATASLMSPGAIEAGTQANPSTAKPVDVERMVEIMDQGALIEPENGYYPLLKSAILFGASTRDIEESEDQQPGFAWTESGHKDSRWAFNRVQIVDQKYFDRALAAFHEAAGKPFMNDHIKDFLQRRLDILPPAKTLGEELYRMSVEWSTLLPNLNHIRSATGDAASVAIQEAEAGHRQRALDLLSDSKAVATLEEHGSNPFLVGLLVSWAIHKNALAEEIVVDNLLKMPAEATAAQQKLRQDEEFYSRVRIDLRGYRYDSLHPETRAHLPQLGFVESLTTPAFTDWSKTDLSPGRNAEYAVLDQLAVVLVVAALLALAGFRMTKTLFYRWRRGQWPTFIFVGWRSVLKILTLAVVLPIAIYTAYLAAFGVRQYGLPVSLERQAVEFAVLGGTIAVALRIMTYSAICQRCIELGLPAGPKYRPSRFELTLAIILLVKAIAYGVYWRATLAGDARIRFDCIGTVIAGTIALFAALVFRPGQHYQPAKPKEIPVKTRDDTWTRPLSPVAIATALGLLALCLISIFTFAGHRTFTESLFIIFPYFLFILLVIAATAFGLFRVARSLIRRQTWSEPLLGVRASVPILLLAALVLSAGAGSLARWNESRNAKQFETSSLNLTTELDRSRLRILRDRMQGDNS